MSRERDDISRRFHDTLANVPDVIILYTRVYDVNGTSDGRGSPATSGKCSEPLFFSGARQGETNNRRTSARPGGPGFTCSKRNRPTFSRSVVCVTFRVDTKTKTRTDAPSQIVNRVTTTDRCVQKRESVFIFARPACACASALRQRRRTGRKRKYDFLLYHFVLLVQRRFRKSAETVRFESRTPRVYVSDTIYNVRKRG